MLADTSNLFLRIRPRVKKRYIRDSALQNLMDKLNHIEVKETDYFKSRSMCFLGLTSPFDSYWGSTPPENDMIYWDINPGQFLNASVIAGSGSGKTRLLKNIIGQYHNLGYWVLVICPKDNEWTSARKVGRPIRLHPLSKSDKLPISDYAPAYVENYIKRTKLPVTSTMNYYSHRIDMFTTREAWMSLTMTEGMADYCVRQVISGIKTIEQLKKKIQEDKESQIVSYSMWQSGNRVLDNLIGTKYINERLPLIDLKSEWEQGNIVTVNYFSRKGFQMSTDVWKIVDLAKDIAHDNHQRGKNQPILILFDDLNFYAEKLPWNIASIGAITDCQTNYRRFGIHVITTLQNPKMVQSDIWENSDLKLVTYIENPDSLSEVLPKEAIYALKAEDEDNGIIYKRNIFPPLIEWILKMPGKDWYRFYPEDCRYGHE